MAENVDNPFSPHGRPEPLVALPDAETLPILAVDDRPENLIALEAVLGPLGLSLVTASSGEEALRLLLERDFALIVLDVRMPGLDGFETARLIRSRERTREVPIVFLTAWHDEVGEIVEGYGVGAVDYVVKPFDPELLRSKVAVFVELEYSRRALRRSEAFLHSAFQAAPIGKTLLDFDRRIVRANPAFAGIVGQLQEALERVPIEALCHPDDRATLASVLDQVGLEAQAERIGGDGLGVDLRLLTAAEREVWVAPTASRIRGTELTTPLLLVQWVEVSSRRNAEQSRAELLLEQATRREAEAQTERLQKLHSLVDTLEARSLGTLLPELARRLAGLFDAEAAEVQVDDGRHGEGIMRVNSAQLERLDPDLAASDSERWQEATLTADGVVIGALRVAAQQGRVLTPPDRALLRDAAEQVSLVIRRVQLHEHEHRIAVELQRGLLPARLPELPGVAMAAHYRAAGLGAEVGGDWYDAFVLPEGRLAVVIGDVTGSGIQVASAMGQLRSVTRAFALEDPVPPSPAEVLTRLNRYHEKVSFEELFTVLYLILDPSDGTVTWANAGHLPPLLRRSSGELATLEGAQSLMSLNDVAYEEHSIPVGEGDTLILYTDGLVERRGEPIDTGLERLGGAIIGGPQEPEALCAHLLASALAGEPQDDLTALVLRLGAGSSPRAVREEREVPQEPIELTVPPATTG